MKNRHDKAREQEDAWLDGNLADLAELSHIDAEAGSPSPTRKAPRSPDAEASASLQDTVPGMDRPNDSKPSAGERKSETPYVSPVTKAKRDDAFHNRHGK